MGKIIWLASYPKSGSTWMRAFIANLVANGEEPLLPDAIRAYTGFEASAPGFSQLAGKSSLALSARELASMRPRVHTAIAQATDGLCVTMTHNFCGSFEGFPLVNWDVTAGVIYVVRNPLDVVVSMTHHFGLTPDAAIDLLRDERVASANDELFVTNFIGAWSSHVKSWTGFAKRFPEQAVVLRYEDLLAKPVASFMRVAQLLGWGDEPARVDRAIAHASFATLARLEREHGFVEAKSPARRFFFKGRAGRWRQVLSGPQVKRVVHDHHATMARFGYLPVND